MDIIRLLNLISEQQQMSDTVEDKLDMLINEVTEEADCLSMEDLEEVRAAAAQVGMEKDPFSER